MKPYAKKRLGQNFLIDPNIIRKIADVISPSQDDTIIEIGPGKGALTELLLQSGAQVHAIEIDDDLIPDLEIKFSNYNNFHLHHCDALKFDFSSIFQYAKKVKYTGNVPYNITTPLLEIAFDNAAYIDTVYFLVQKEVARRIAGVPSTKEYGILSVMVQYYGNPTLHFDVSPNVFRPIPKVVSAFISIKVDENRIDRNFLPIFRNVVKTAFNKRRKTLRNSLRELLPNNIKNCPIDLVRRAETLNIKEFEIITKFIQKNTDFSL